MSEHKQPHEQHEQQKSEQEQAFDFLGELNRLGQNLEQTVRSALESDHAKSFQRDVSAGMKEFFTQLQGVTRSVQEDDRMRDMTKRGQQAINEVQEKVQENKTLQDLQTTMARSIAYLNSQLNDFNENLQNNEQQAGSSGAQSVPIDEEEDTPQTPASNIPPSTPQTPASNIPPGNPATGQTIRLDPDKPADDTDNTESR